MTRPLPPWAPWEQLNAIGDAIEAATDLRRTDPLYVLGQPGSLLHRRYGYTLPSTTWGDADLGVQPQPGGDLQAVDDVVLVVSHDIDPADHDASWRVAVTDVAAAIAALLASPCRHWIRVVGGTSVPTVVGSRIEQRVTLSYRYYLKIPEAT